MTPKERATWAEAETALAVAVTCGDTIGVKEMQRALTVFAAGRSTPPEDIEQLVISLANEVRPDLPEPIETLVEALHRIKKLHVAHTLNEKTLQRRGERIAEQDAEIGRLRKEVANAKALVVDVYAMLPEQAIRARHELDKRAGPWFVFGQDRNAPVSSVRHKGISE